MISYTVFFSLCVALAAAVGTNVEYYNLSGYDDERELLKSELKLAGKPNLYVLFDLSSRKIYLKARGMILKELPVEYMRYWGSPAGVGPYGIIGKSSLFSPGRNEIKPYNKNDAGSDKDNFQIQALELDDMPANYTLTFDENITVYIRSARRGILGSLSDAGGFLQWYALQPLKTVWSGIRNRPYSAIKLTMTEDDARSLYWSFSEGVTALIYYQRSL